jgi:NAD(P)-dependent dehydrogenase (short-subunit alcohol dehydrogenase family)
MPKSILITGAGSGFGEGAALQLAAKGHSVIAGVHIAPQKTELLAKTQAQGVDLDVIVLDITNEAQRQMAFRYEVDVLINNADVIEGGPAAEIPIRQNHHYHFYCRLDDRTNSVSLCLHQARPGKSSGRPEGRAAGHWH